MGFKKIKPVINLYLRQLKKTINPQRVVIFGSFAKGIATAESDLDLVIISPDFANLSFDQRFSILATARLHPQLRKVAMDVFGYTPEEFTAASPLTTLGEVKETGVDFGEEGSGRLRRTTRP